jgi:hypothetical protein
VVWVFGKWHDTIDGNVNGSGSSQIGFVRVESLCCLQTPDFNGTVRRCTENTVAVCCESDFVHERTVPTKFFDTLSRFEPVNSKKRKYEYE